jgi:uncharacterized protein
MSSIAWFEIAAGDTGRAQKFYGELLGWQFQPFEPGGDYYMAGEAGGAIYPGANGQPSVLVYFGVDDVEAATARVGDLGGEAGEIQEIPGVGRYSICTDTEGNRIGLYQAQGA